METLEKILALPGKVLENPENEFSYTFYSWSWVQYFLAILALMPVSVFGIPFFWHQEDYDIAIALGVIAFIVFFFMLFGLFQTLKVTCIVCDNLGVTFSGSIGRKRLFYKRIIFISNDRYINGRGRLFGTGGFFIPGRGFGTPRPSMGLKTMGPQSDMLDTSSTSSAYSNTVSVSSTLGNVSFTFSGGGNREFVRALAIIIYMSKLKNPDCNISKRAIFAAAKSIDL